MFEWVWSEWFWLKPGVTWKDLELVEGKQDQTYFSDLYYMPIAACLFFYVFRNHFLLPYIFSPIGKYYGVRSKPYKPPHDKAELQKLYNVNRARPPRRLLQKCVAELGLEERKVQRWLRQKALSEQMTTLDKFNDFGYQFVYFTSMNIIGFIVLTRQNFFWDLRKCFEDYPHTSLPPEVKVYFMLQMGFYMLQCCLILIHTKRHDFYVMLTHHLASLILLAFCYIAKFHRLCILSALLHDTVDIYMAFGKLFNYCGRTDISDACFTIFVLIWFPTRLVLFPFHILRGTLFVGPEVLGGTWPCQHFLNVFNLILLILHCIWSSELIPAIKHKLTTNEIIIDTRSSQEEMSENETNNYDSNMNVSKKLI